MGIIEIGFYFLLEIQASIFEGLKIQILGVIEKCIGWFRVYLLLGGFFIKSAKRMCIYDYIIFSIDTF